MTWLIAALLAAFINGTSAIFDKKLLLRQGLSDPVAYTFWVGILGTIALLLIPFGFVALPFQVILTAILGGIIFIFALLAFFTALYRFNALGFLQLVGGFTPVLTLIVSAVFLSSIVSLGNIIGLIIIILGTFVFLFMEEHSARFGVFYLAVLSSACFSISDILKKVAFNQGPFLSVFIWTSVGGALVSLVMVLLPVFRKRIFNSASTAETRNKSLYLLNRAWAASAAVASHYAIFLGHPALVETVLSFKYVVIFAASLFILKEKVGFKAALWKITGTVLIIIGVIWLGLVDYIHNIPKETNMQWGITFSQKFASQLEGGSGPDVKAGWKRIYLDMLDDLGVKNLRLIAYWDIVEPKENAFDFSELDWQIGEAKKRGATIILALGRKTPRWPECNVPSWAGTEVTAAYEQNLFDYVKATVEHYKNDYSISTWQVENEPMFPFGECRPLGFRFLQSEINLVKSLDNRPIALTDSGELGFAWPVLSIQGDMFGTTLYRYVHNRFLGDIRYSLIPPEYFQLKRIWAHDILGKDIFIAELQGEPWEAVSMTPDRFNEIAEYAKDSGFPKAYWWGVEWWHSEKEKGRTEMWNLAKQLFIK